MVSLPFPALSKAGKVVDSVSKESTFSLDVPSYLIMNTYTGTNDVDSLFSATGSVLKAKKGWNLSLYWNPVFLNMGFLRKLSRHGMYDYQLNGFGISLTKDLHRNHSLRFAYDISKKSQYVYQYESGINPELIPEHHSFSLDYLFNVTNQLFGYHGNRKNEWIFTSGFELGRSSADLLASDTVFQSEMGVKPAYLKSIILGKKIYWGIHAGIQYRHNINNCFEYFVEPQLNIWEDAYDMKKGYATIDPGITVKTGFIYRFLETKQRLPWGIPLYDSEQYKCLDNTFVQIGLGTSLSFRSNSLGYPSSNKNGLAWSASIGKWFDRTMAFRLGAFQSVAGFAFRGNDVLPMEYKGGRFESVFNPVSIIQKKEDSLNYRLEFNAGIGIEYGTIAKMDNYKKRAFGVTGSSQLHFHTNPWVSLFLESRYSKVRYDSYKDNISSFSMGIQYALRSRPLFEFYRHVLNEDECHGIENYSSHNNIYNSYLKWDRYKTRPIAQRGGIWYYEIGSGFSLHRKAQAINGARFLDVLFDGAIGYKFKDQISSIRAKGELIFSKGNKMRVSKEQYYSLLALDYFFDISNAWLGINDRRHHGLSVMIGPLVHLHDFDDNNRQTFLFGGEVALHPYLRLSEKTEFYLEPVFQYLSGFRNHWGLSTGVSYLLSDKIHFSKSEDKKGGRGYVQLLYGYQLGYISTAKNRLRSQQRWDNYDLTYGRRINKITDIRSSIFTHALHVCNDKNSHYFGTRLEGVVNVINLITPNFSIEKGINASVSLGGEGGRIVNFNIEDAKGRIRDVHHNIGITASGQLQLRLNKFVPRLSDFFSNPAWLTLQARAYRLRIKDVGAPVIGSAGLQFDLDGTKWPEYGNRARLRSSNMQDSCRWSVYAAWGGNCNQKQEFLVGCKYDINRIHGVMLHVSYSGTDISKYGYRSEHWYSFAPTYCFNASRAVFQNSLRPCVELSFFAGPETTSVPKKALMKTFFTKELFHMTSYMGVTVGSLVDFGNPDGNFVLMIEPRLSIQPFNRFITPDRHFTCTMHNMVGIRYKFGI